MTGRGNAQQIEYWNGRAGLRWAELQERIDRHLEAITEGLMGFAVPKPGERALDIGCGCGTTTLLLARAVGPTGSVAGIDVSAPMLAVARARAERARIALLEADASDWEFQPVNDLVFSRFGMMFFADPAAAFGNIRRALAPGGRLAFACWRAMEENPWAQAPFEAARHLLPPAEAAAPEAPGPFALADGARITRLLAQAGWRDIRVERFDTAMNMGATIADAAAESLNIGPLARAAGEVDEAVRAKILAAVGRALASFAGPAGVTPPAACWFVGAKA